MSQTTAPAPTEDDFFGDAIEKLKSTQLGARQDLKVSRHLFRGTPSYIVHDPISFQSHRFSQADYEVLSALDKTRTLQEVYESLASQNKLKGDERSFYEYILNLQMRGLLDLPITNGNRLYQRYLQRQEMAKKKSLMKLLFIKIPLFNPDGFLDRTMHLARPLFTRFFFYIFCVMMVAAVGLLFARWDEFYLPLADLLATRNLLILVLVMTALKFWHELGHAYACKLQGGAVPDMGGFLMVGMPMAYVDVSSSWSFGSRRGRILVGLGGMYFEMIAACIAMFIWAFTSEGLVHSTAHFVVLMASFMTILFNANPLMRYDGYYVLSDLTGIPNLRGRSTQYANGLLKQITLGLPMSTGHAASDSVREMVWMLVYGVAAVVYQFWLILTISFMVASQYYLVGMAVGAVFGASAIILPLKKCLTYLWFDTEVEHVRERAVGLSAALIGGLAAVTLFVPVPGGVVTSGQLTYQDVEVHRLPFDCYLNEICVEPNQVIDAQTVLVKVKNPELKDQFMSASANLRVAKQMMMAASASTAAEQRSLMYRKDMAQAEVQMAKCEMQRQTVESTGKGVVLECPKSRQIGSYIPMGTELAKVGRGQRMVRVILNDKQFANSRPEVGDRVSVRLRTSGNHRQSAIVTRVEPSGSNMIEMPGLTQAAGGDILVDQDGMAMSPHFLVDVTFEEDTAQEVAENTTAHVRFRRKFESIGSYTYKHFRMFTNKLFAK